MNEKDFIELGYAFPRLLKSGEWAAVYPFLFTTGLVVGLNESGYRTRYCYKSPLEAAVALTNWDGLGDPPGPWIKQKGGVERTNPNFQNIPIVME